MIKAVLFDFDGTLANTLPFFSLAYKRALSDIGFMKTDEEVVPLCFGKKEDVICTSLGIPEKTEQFATSYFNGVKTLFKQAQLFPDTLKTIEILKEKKVKMAIITFAYRWYIDQMMEQFHLAPYIDLIISNDDVKNPKPNPESVYIAAKSFGIEPNEAIVIGDSKSDILMAKNAGAQSALMFPEGYSRYYKFDELRQTKPDFIVQSISELRKLL